MCGEAKANGRGSPGRRSTGPLRLRRSRYCVHLKRLVWKKYRYRFDGLSAGITQLLQTPCATTASLSPTVKSIELSERRSNFSELNRKSGTARKGQEYGS